MRITFRKSGGLAGLLLGLDLDLEGLPRAQARRWEARVRESGFWRLTVPPPAPSPDVEIVLLRIERGTKSKEVLLASVDIPPGLSALVAALSRRARFLPPNGPGMGPTGFS